MKEALKNDVDLSLYGDQIDEQLKKYSVKNVPAAGVLAKDLPDSHQLSFPEA